jgi:hypothetical protein
LANPPTMAPIEIATTEAVSPEINPINLPMDRLPSKSGNNCHEQQHEGDDGAGLVQPPVMPKLVHGGVLIGRSFTEVTITHKAKLGQSSSSFAAR